MKSQIISAKQDYLEATNTLILRYKRKLELIQKLKIQKTMDEQMELIQFLQKIQQDQQQRQQDKNIDRTTTCFLRESITQKQNTIVKSSFNITYRCSCHNMTFESPQALGGHLRDRRKK